MKKTLTFILLLTFCLSVPIFAAVADISNISIQKAINETKKIKEEQNRIVKKFENQIRNSREKLIKDYNTQTTEEQKQETANTIFENNKKALKSIIDNLNPLSKNESELLDKYYNDESNEKAVVVSAGEFNIDKSYFMINIKYKEKTYNCQYKFKGNNDDNTEIVSMETAKVMHDIYKLFIVKPLYKIDYKTLSPKLACFRVNHTGTGVTEDLPVTGENTIISVPSANSVFNAIYLNLLQIDKLSQFPSIKQETITELKLTDILLKNKYFDEFKNIISKNNVTVKIVASPCHTVGLKADGTVVACGLNQNKQCNVNSLNFYIYDIAVNEFDTVGLSINEQIQYCGWNKIKELVNWKDIVSVKLGKAHAVGLKQDGTVVACGDNSKGQCDVKNWKDIVAISAGDNHTTGLQQDGTVVTCGDNSLGQCNVQTWTDIKTITAKFNNTVAIKQDGTVVACGDNSKGQCSTETWQNIVDVSVGYVNIAGIKEDGTVIVSGDNSQKQCNVEEWKNIVKTALGNYYTVGLKQDGTVVATGWNDYGQCDTSEWADIIDVFASYGHVLGLTKDGKVVATGWNDYGQCNVQSWNN